MTKKVRRSFTEEFKQLIVQLYENGKPRKVKIREYELTPSSLDKWINQSKTSGSFKEKDNLSPELKELQELRKRNKQLEMENDILKQAALIFHQSRQNYGTRKIKHELKKRGKLVSRRRIGRIMNEQGLVSAYTVAQFKPHKDKPNESDQANELNREFTQKEELTVVVSDLTYVRVHKKWHYICVFVDLYNRENKDALLVYRALSSIKGNLHTIQMFHTDRGREFKNQVIDEALETFNIMRSLSLKGCPYDNAVAEATFKIIKTEFEKKRYFDSLEELHREFTDYVHWFNHLRIHGTLDYLSPVEYKLTHLKKTV